MREDKDKYELLLHKVKIIDPVVWLYLKNVAPNTEGFVYSEHLGLIQTWTKLSGEPFEYWCNLHKALLNFQRKTAVGHYIELTDLVELFDLKAAEYLRHDALLLPDFKFKALLSECFWFGEEPSRTYWFKISMRLYAIKHLKILRGEF
jgi:hypothetical protein